MALQYPKKGNRGTNDDLEGVPQVGRDGGVVITKHAYKRAKERLKWSRTTTRRMADTAFKNGITSNDCTGQIRNYLDTISCKKDHKANNIKVYGEVIYLFADITLITVYQLPTIFKTYIKRIRK